MDYDLSKIRGIVFDVDGVLSPSTIPMDSNGDPMRMVNIKDGYALQLAAKLGMKMAIITGAKTPAVRCRYQSLGLKDIYIAVAEKLPCLERWMAERGLRAEEVMYVGDDIPDMPCLLAVGLGVAPADAAREIKDAARYISPLNGGYGVARDVIEQTLKAQGLWLHQDHAFGW